MTKKYFGTDGIRGRVGSHPITPEFMLKLGWAAGMAFRKQGKCRILIGKDTRISGYMLISSFGRHFRSARSRSHFPGIDAARAGWAA